VTQTPLRLGAGGLRKDRPELQMRDVRNLLSGECDVAYLRQWAPALKVTDLLEDCLRERHQP